MKALTPALLSLTLPIAALAQAEPARTDTGLLIYAVGGTGGVGAGVGLHLGERFTVRAEMADYKYDTNVTEAGIRYDAGVKLATQGAYLDFKPFAGTFRITAGANFSSHSLATLSFNDVGGATIGGVNYPGLNPGDLRASVDYGTRPYVGIGWGLARDGFTMGLDLGVEIGSPEIRLTGVGVNQADLDAELADLQDALSKLDLYPIVKISIGYSF